jgi:hypothetical protein
VCEGLCLKARDDVPGSDCVSAVKDWVAETNLRYSLCLLSAPSVRLTDGDTKPPSGSAAALTNAEATWYGGQSPWQGALR